ncbi:phage tail length tape measure family protein [Neotabrizicola sp. VNH66]|uniref:phage tail length tape measure family protein n=1 Tax=Neotabrizicola sp. VNH66 TaxID=3400918 RepID=UPI003C0FEB7B
MAVEVGPALGLTADSKGLQVAIPVLEKVRDAAKQAQAAAEGLAKGADKAAAAEGKAAAAASKAAADTVKLANGLQMSTVAAAAEARAQAARAQAALSAAKSSGTASAADIKAAQAARDLAAAHRDAANAALLAEKAAMTQGQAQVDLSGKTMHTANVFAQANDIVLMAVSGQSPMMLAMQQGMQLNQVWATMGGNLKNIGSIIGSSFMMMLNPINLATIGIIAGGAALVQWAMSAGDASGKADELVETLGNLATAASDYQTAIENAQQSRLQLIADFGSQAEAAERLYEAQARLREFDLIDTVVAAQATISDGFSSIQAQVDTATRGLQVWSREISSAAPDFERIASASEISKLGIEGLKDEFGMTLPQAQALLRTVDAMATTDGPHAMAMAIIDFNEQLAKSRAEGAKIPPEMMRVANEAATAAGEILRMAGALQSASDIASSIVIPLGMTSGSSDWLNGFTSSELLPMNPRGSSAPPRVRGGGGGNERKTALEGLIAELQTETEALKTWYDDKLKLINSYTELELEALGGRHGAIERLEAEHKQRLWEINDSARQMELSAQRGMYSELAGLLGMFAGESRAAAIAQIGINTALRLAETAQNTAAASMRAIAELGPIAGPPAAAKIAAYGKVQMALIAAAGVAQGLGGGGRGGSSTGGGAAGGGTASSPEPPLRVSADAFDSSQLYTGEAVQRWFDAIQAEAGNRGIVWVPV